MARVAHRLGDERLLGLDTLTVVVVVALCTVLGLIAAWALPARSLQ